MTSPAERLAELGLTLPAVAAPVAAYIPAVRTGSYVYTSGQLPFVDGALPQTGKVGADVTPDDARELARTAALIAREMRLSEEQIWMLRHAAQLHDIGKIGVPDEILLKPGPLDPDEFELMKTHTVIGWQILSGSTARVLAVAAHIALSHHERFDGRGYPNALAGDAIPLPARITAVADVFDTLTHVRPYREAFPVERAVEEIRRLARTTFDPRVVGAFDVLDHAALLEPVEPESLEAAPV